MNMMETNVELSFRTFEEHSRSIENFILPCTLMDCFETFRRQELLKASRRFTDPFLSHLFELMSEFRGPDDPKQVFDEIFDPAMYFVDNSPWTAPPGRTIHLPALNTEVVARVAPTSPLVELAEEEVSRFLRLSDSYMDEDMIGLAEMAAAAYGDLNARFTDRRAAVRYVAINASAKIEDLFTCASGPWARTARRVLDLPDITAVLKQQLRQNTSLFADSPLTDGDMDCYTEEEIRLYAFNTHKFLLSGKTKHFTFCGPCQEKIADWVERAKEAEEQALSMNGGQLPQA